MLNLLKDIITGGGFTGAWYIIALVIGTVILFYASKKVSAGCMIALTLPIYVLCCLATNYWNVCGNESLILRFFDVYRDVTYCDFYTSFPAALLWISIGRFFAVKKSKVKPHTLIWIFVILIPVVAFERFFIVTNGWAVTDDCYFSLILLCPIVFLIALGCPQKISKRYKLRELSTLIYVMHGSVGRLVGYVLKLSHLNFLDNEAVKIAVTLSVILLLGYVLLYLKDKKKFRLLRYAC
jgi:hypothetical protein